MRRWVAVVVLILMAHAGVAWADELTRPIVGPLPLTRVEVEPQAEAPPAATKIRAERIKIDALLVYDVDGKPASLMLLDVNGNVFATLKVK